MKYELRSVIACVITLSGERIRAMKFLRNTINFEEIHFLGLSIIMIKNIIIERRESTVLLYYYLIHITHILYYINA